MHFRNFKNILNGLNLPVVDNPIGINLDDEEFEERIYKEIKNLGKYVMYLDNYITDLNDSRIGIFINYIIKYPI